MKTELMVIVNSTFVRTMILILDVGLALASGAQTARGQASAPRKPAGPSSSARQATKIPPGVFEALKVKADAARQANRVSEAIQLYRQLLSAKPSWPEGWWYLGTLHYDTDQYPPGALAFKRFTDLEPKNGQGWAMLGLCEYRLKDYISALDHLASARTLGLGGNEDLARVVRYHQAVLFTLGRQFESALDLLKGFAREQLESATILDAMGMAVLRIHAPFEKLTPEQRDMVRQFGKAEFLAGERKAAESLTAYQELEERYRGQPDVAYASGLAFVNLTEYEKAEAAFKRELERDPRHAPSLVKLALLAIQRSRYPEGLPYAEQAAAIDSESFAAHYALGRIYLELNEVDKAVTVLEKAAKIAPSIPSVQFVLSRAYTRAGRSQDAARARAEFQRLEELDKQRRGEAASATEAGATPQQPSAARR